VRRALLVLAAFALFPPAAAAQPDSGIARPDGEQGLSLRELGSQLYAGNCSSCHGIDGRGVKLPRKGTGSAKAAGPALRGVGAQAVDFYLRTGYMPLGSPDDQPTRRRPQFREREIRALTAYVASLKPGPPIPRLPRGQVNVAEGMTLFTEHCAGCHQVAAQGGVATGAKVPPLQDATPEQIAEAVRIGPYVMPRFPKSQISDAELASIVAYVHRTQHPVNRGGWGIGNIGPVPEGMVTWLIAAAAFIGVCLMIGERRRRA
jgi:ubiquinol-cytochrome c reductase cytochrome c subunit